LLVIDDFSMPKPPLTAAENPLEIVMRATSDRHAAQVEQAY